MIILDVGHSSVSQGAENVTHGISEFKFNSNLAKEIKKYIDVNIFYRNSYQNLPKEINAFNPDYVVSLHCNAFNKKASGSEVLFYHSSLIGKDMASIYLNHLVDCLDLPNRGIKPKVEKDRGGFQLKYIKAPCIISEPFFIDNDTEFEFVESVFEDFVMANVNALNEISCL